MAQNPDAVDHILAAWAAALPDLDAGPLAVVGRVLVLAAHLEKSVTEALAPHNLALGQFDILATLRRNGPGGGLTPGRLLETVMLSSGGMTSRLDRLETNGLVRRTVDPTDRRGVIVELTPKGRKKIDAATAARFAEAKQSLPPLDADDMKTLETLLRRWLATYSA